MSSCPSPIIPHGAGNKTQVTWGDKLAALEADHQKACQFTKKQVKGLRQALSENDTDAEAVYTDTLLRHPKCLFVAAVAANQKLKPGKRQSLAACRDLAEVFDFSLPLSEVVPVRPIPKGSGGYRIIHNHGLMHRTAQQAINKVLGEHLKPRPFQFTLKGTHAAIYHARAMIGAGYIYAARLDIKDYYSSFSAEALINGLPIPQDVVAHAVIGRHMKVCIDKGSKTRGYLNGQYASLAQSLLPLARQGVPTGSATSSVVSILTISRLVWVPIAGVAIINYADDFFVLAVSPELLANGVAALTESVAQLPDGHFNLANKQQGLVANGICFLGHQFYFEDGQLQVAPSQASMQAIWKDLSQLEEQITPLFSKLWKKDHTLALRLAATYYSRVRGYRAAFSACNVADMDWLSGMLEGLGSTLQSLGISAAKAKAAVEPWMATKTYGYMFKD